MAKSLAFLCSIDVNECSARCSDAVKTKCHTCDQTAGNCTNSPGSYTCSCTSGYRLQADARSCTGIWLFHTPAPPPTAKFPSLFSFFPFSSCSSCSCPSSSCSTSCSSLLLLFLTLLLLQRHPLLPFLSLLMLLLLHHRSSCSPPASSSCPPLPPPALLAYLCHTVFTVPYRFHGSCTMGAAIVLQLSPLGVQATPLH